jgi:molybdenum cofactor cytidylyltransferase
MRDLVSGLVLAAGTSSRLGKQPKQLLPWRGTTLVGWVIQQAENSLLDEILVVVGHEAEEVQRVVAVTRAKFVKAADFHEGCTASIRAGLEAVDSRAGAAMLILGDQPEIKSETIDAVITGWRKIQKPVARACYRGVSGHPMLFARELFGQLKALHGDKGVWKILEAHPEWLGEVELDEPFPGNINTWDDYSRLSSENVATGERRTAHAGQDHEEI